MKIILSPAKIMKDNLDILEHESLPIYIKEAEILKDKVRKLTFEDQKKLWKTSDKLTSENRERFENMNLYSNLSPAIYSFQGNRYKRMGPLGFNDEEIEYLQEHLRILSGFYGILKPLDGIRPYRLDMENKLEIDGNKDLYEFWGDKIYRALIDSDRTIINLASKEYERVVKKYLQDKDIFITIIFAKLMDGKLKQNPSKAKMARGEMVRFMAERNIESINEIRDFSILNFSFSEEFSTENEIVFLENI